MADDADGPAIPHRPSSPERRLALDGAANFRDLGGYPTVQGGVVRWRRLFRSDALSALSEADQEGLKRLAVRTVFDLRLPGERRTAPSRLPSDIARVELGFVPHGTLDMLADLRAGRLHGAAIAEEVCRHYWRMPRDHGTVFGAVLRRLAEPESPPAVIHCTSGKDRTGVTIAFLLLALGVPLDTVFEDYLLTNHYRRDIAGLLNLDLTVEDMAVLTSADARYLQTAFDSAVDLSGSLEHYIELVLGIDGALRGRLRAAFLE